MFLCSVLLPDQSSKAGVSQLNGRLELAEVNNNGFISFTGQLAPKSDKLSVVAGFNLSFKQKSKCIEDELNKGALVNS
ncbi:MAG: hypothetical protein DMG06_22295 [Acidobacteria bacterium]|nr:MAG: hypothetical protein DMG06_22295 [Acidobacteriota bacterium]